MNRYSAERKAAVIRKMLPPLSVPVSELVRQEGISDVTLYHWRKQVIARGEKVSIKEKVGQELSGEAKLAAVVETAPLSEAERSRYCREKGLYPEQVKAWRQACIEGQEAGRRRQQADGARARADQLRIRELERELQRKEKALAEAAALLMLRKKMNALWEDEAVDN
jgi:transposase